ncbi:glutamate ABC transporter substrate-binding protein [Compostimonas suwonensis]|uniref:Glutamate transport system substrate-binding protein n=1 Tax=Compostimonas suwonensis TaxID=1048394 RepID=A0A2M9BTP9_9MICO|nr:glutamate ABC transporter substrate-binding protein [Compostimonas suwonensis]PJJ61316.1 glutamate transport system substrate-binding protein [Compostimonas suwonensis]
MRSRRLVLGIAAAAVALTLTACGAPGSAGSGDDTGAAEEATGDGPYNLEIAESPEFDEGTTMAELAAAGAMTIGTKFDQPLFGLLGTGDKPEGFDVAIGALVASKLGIPFDSIEWVETPSPQREQSIQNGTVDAVVATYTINDARKELVDFAGPYFEAGQAIMVLADDDTIIGPDDLAGQPVCSVEGSTPAKNIVDTYGAELIATDIYSNCLDPLRNGQVVAVTTDNVILSGFVDQNEGEFKLAGDGETFTEEPYGIGLELGDTEFRGFVNDVLQEAFDDGTWARLFDETAGEVLPTPDPPTIDRY